METITTSHEELKTTTSAPQEQPVKRLASIQILSSSGAVNQLTDSEASNLWTRVVRDKRVKGKAGCWIHPNKPNTKGYVQVALSIDKKVYTHHLAMRMTKGKDSIPKDRSRNISHLCMNSSCCNPDHIVVESAEENHARKNCSVKKIVTCPCGCAHSFEADLCPSQSQMPFVMCLF